MAQFLRCLFHGAGAGGDGREGTRDDPGQEGWVWDGGRVGGEEDRRERVVWEGS